MIGFSAFTHIYIAKDPVDCRCGIDRFASIVFASLDHDPFDGSLYIFTNRRHNILKCLFFDGNSFWLLYKRLEEGTFQWTNTNSACSPLTLKQLQLLLNGMMIESPRSFCRASRRSDLIL